jgi:hypothetical protein
MPRNWGELLYFRTVLIHRQGKIMWTEGDWNVGYTPNWNGGDTPSRLGEEKGRILKREILEDLSGLPISGSPSTWRSSLLYFHFLFPNKYLLNSLTIFLPLNSLSSREKEPVPLDGNRCDWV